jgi:hypothetical protein
MPLLSKTRKLQSGASLNQAKNEPAITDVRWKQFDVSGYKHTPLDINSAMMDQGANGRAGSKSGASGGLPSDIAYVNDQLKKYRNNLKMGLSGSNAKEYGESAQAKEDSDQVVKWSEKLTMLKSREDNYKANSLRLGKSTTDDYAIFGGKALAKDNSAAGAFVIVDAQDLLTKRTKDAKGKTTNQYTPATIGEALAVRLDDPNFSGFNDNGGILDNILASAQDASSVEKEMDSMFTRVGSVNETADTFVSNQTGNASSLTELIKTLEDANKVHSTGVTIKTNQPNLLGAVQLFKNNIGPAQLEALRGKAIAKFLSEYGSQDIKNPASVAEWIEAKLDSDITERALVFLKKSQNKSKTASGATSTADALSKKETGMNLITAIQMGGSTGHKVTLSTNSYKDADDLKKRMDLLVSVGAEGLDIVPAVRGTGTKEDPNTLETNPFIRTLTRGELRTNLFLGDHDSTPVANLAKQNGLKLAAINTTSYGQNMQVLRNMPYTEVDGRKKIAWDYVEKAIEFGKEFSKREQKVLETTKRPYLKMRLKLFNQRWMMKDLVLRRIRR